MSIAWSSPDGMANATAEVPLIHISGLTQVLLIALLAAPIWLFGLLIGLLLPKGFTESRAASVATESASSVSSIDSDAAAYAAAGGPSSRPLSDDELAASEADDDWDEETEAAPLSRTAAVKTASTDRELATAAAAAGSTVRRTVAWAQQLLTFGASTEPEAQPQDAKDAKIVQRRSTAAAGDAGPAGPLSPFAVNNDTAAPQLPNGLHAPAFASGRFSPATPETPSLKGAAAGGAGSGSQWSAGGDSHVWYVGLPDLERFSSTVDPLQDRLLSGKLGQGWSMVMDKDVPGVVRYVSYMRPTDAGSTDYLSVTIVPNATAQEIHEFNLDDACRSRWDPMLKSTWLLGSRQLAAAEQLVVWLRSFPMGFLSDRLYAGIARRTFTDPHQPHCLFGVSKVVHTPVTAAWAAENFPGVIQTDNYYSAWRCRTIPSPWDTAHNSSGGDAAGGSSIGGSGPLGGGQPACELVLLHHDELKVPEGLARMAIKLGMWKFVQGMVDAAGGWLEERRSRIDPFTDDPAAACRRPAPALTGATALAAAEGAAAAPDAASASMPGSGAGIDALLGEADALAMPRRLVAVPTAPDLLSIPGVGSDDGQAGSSAEAFREPWSGVAAAGAAPVAAATPRAARLQVAGHKPGHRRASSMDWTPKPDDSSSNSTQSLGRRRSAELRHPKPAATSAAAAAGGPSVLHLALPPISTARQDSPDPGQQQGQPQQQQEPSQQQQQQPQQQGPLHFVRGLVVLPAAAHGVVGSIGGVGGQLWSRTADAVRWLGRRSQPAEAAAAAGAATGAGGPASAAGSVTSSQDAAPGVHGSNRDQGDRAGVMQPVKLGQPAAAAAPAAAAPQGAGRINGTWAVSKAGAAVGGAGLDRKRSSAGRAGGGGQGAGSKLVKLAVRGVVLAAAVAVGAGLAGVGPAASEAAGDGLQPGLKRHKRRSLRAAH